MLPHDIHIPNSSGMLLLFLVLCYCLHMRQKLFLNVDPLLVAVKYSLNCMSDNKIFSICDIS